MSNNDNQRPVPRGWMCSSCKPDRSMEQAIQASPGPCPHCGGSMFEVAYDLMRAVANLPHDRTQPGYSREWEAVLRKAAHYQRERCNSEVWLRDFGAPAKAAWRDVQTAHQVYGYIPSHVCREVTRRIVAAGLVYLARSFSSAYVRGMAEQAIRQVEDTPHKH